VARNAAAVALFGTQAEDLGQALYQMDLSTAVEQLNGVEGAAQRMFDTLADNDATKLEQAQRNIEVGVQGIQGALAAAFSEPLGDFADWVSQNRGPMLQFFSDLMNGAIDFAIAATEGTGEFVAGPLAEMVEGIAVAIDLFNLFEGKPTELTDLAEGMRGFSSSTDDAVASLEGMRGEFNGFADGQIQMGNLNDASLRLADSIGRVGDGSADMETQVRNAVAALGDEISAADAAGESQVNLAGRYGTATQALVDQMVAAGYTEEAARALIDTVLETPATASTAFGSNAPQEQAKVQGLADRITTLPDGSVVIRADDTPARSTMDSFIRSYNGKSVGIGITAQTIVGNPSMGWRGDKGGVLEFMAHGGLTPMSPVAQMVPANTWRVVGDRSDVSEAYIPLDGSPRSLAILGETMRRMGVTPMGEGGMTSRTQEGATRPTEAVFHLYDVDGRLMATMRGVAAEVTDDFASSFRGGVLE